MSSIYQGQLYYLEESTDFVIRENYVNIGKRL